MPSRTDATREALLAGALEEFVLVGYRRSSMESAARRAGVSRATLYGHFGGKEELFRALVAQLHAAHESAMAAAIDAPAKSLEARLVAVLEARFGRWLQLTATSPHAAELYDQHNLLCGDLARASEDRSRRLLAAFVRDADRDGLIDTRRLGLTAPQAAGVLLDCASGAKGEGAEDAGQFRARLQRVVRMLVGGLQGPTAG